MIGRVFALVLAFGVLAFGVLALPMGASGQPAAPAAATEVVYPLGSRLGLVPPAGFTPSRNFPGFEDRENNAYIRLVVMPPQAYDEVLKTMTPEMFTQQGLTFERRDDIEPKNGSKGVMLVMGQEIGGIKLHKWLMLAPFSDTTAMVSFEIPDNVQSRYAEGAIRAAMVSTTLRDEVPADEMLQLVPFRLSELGGLRVLRVVPGVAVQLTDGVKDIFDAGQSHMVISAAVGGPTEARDREKFARMALGGLPPFRDVRITSSEPLRINGQPGHELRAVGKDMTTGQDVEIVQWLRFGTGGYLHMIAFATREHWAGAFPRFRAIRDGINPR